MKSQYDAFAQDFSQHRQGAWPEFEFLLPHLKKSDKILDLGCGNGRLRKFIPEDKISGGQYYGLDISTELLSIARKSFLQDHFFKGDFSKPLIFGADNFDVVTAIASFHHLLSPASQKLFLRECFRVLRPGGMIFLTTWKLPSRFFWPNILRGRFYNWNIPFGNEKFPRTYRLTNERILRSLLKKAGFVVQECFLFEERNFVVRAEKK